MTPPFGWKCVGDNFRKSFLFPDFRTALEFVNRVGEAAVELRLAWGQVDVTVSSEGAQADRIDQTYFSR